MTKIAVNTRLLKKNQMDGIGWFAYNTLKNIVLKKPQIEFHFFFDSVAEKDFIFGNNVVPHNLFPPAKHALLNIAWSEWSVKRALKRVNPDLYFSPDGIICLGWDGKQHGVIHDINFAHNPGDLKFSNRKYYNYYFPKFAKKAARLATVSEFSKQDIHNSFGIEENKVDVVYCGINSFYRPVSNEIIESTRNKYTGGKPYFLFVGTLSPRKNVLGLMKAFELFKQETGSTCKLLIAGGGMYKEDALYSYQREMKFASDIVFTGRLDDNELNNVFNAAICLTYVPFFEGFGIPVIEAMECNIPIITSNVTSLPEVIDNAGLLVDPNNIEEIKNAMIRIETNKDLRSQLIEMGKIRRQFFSWENTSNLLWNSLNKCL